MTPDERITNEQPPYNAQVAPFPEVLSELVASLRYRKGWRFELSDMPRGQGSSGLTLRILITCTDTYYPDQKIRIQHYMPVPPAAFNKESWTRWLLDQILLVERHESCEFFQIGDRRPYAPHHGPGNDPYIIFDHGAVEDARTDYLGERRNTDAPNK